MKPNEAIKEKARLEKSLKIEVEKWFLLAISEVSESIKTSSPATISKKLEMKLEEILKNHYKKCKSKCFPIGLEKAEEDYLQELFQQIKQNTDDVVDERAKKQILIIWASAKSGLLKEAIRAQRLNPEATPRELAAEYKKTARAKARGAASSIAITETNWAVEASNNQTQKTILIATAIHLTSRTQTALNSNEIKKAVEESKKMSSFSSSDNLKKKINVLAKKIENATMLEAGSIVLGAAVAITLKKKWTTEGDDKVRQTHQATDGIEVELDEPFEVGASMLMYPGDDSLGAEIEELINCRCTVEYT